MDAHGDECQLVPVNKLDLLRMLMTWKEREYFEISEAEDITDAPKSSGPTDPLGSEACEWSKSRCRAVAPRIQEVRNENEGITPEAVLGGGEPQSMRSPSRSGKGYGCPLWSVGSSSYFFGGVSRKVDTSARKKPQPMDLGAALSEWHGEWHSVEWWSGDSRRWDQIQEREKLKRVVQLRRPERVRTRVPSPVREDEY